MQYFMSLFHESIHIHRLVVQGELEGSNAQHREAYDADPHDKTAYNATFIPDDGPS
jgi:hypothetical protein